MPSQKTTTYLRAFQGRSRCLVKFDGEPSVVTNLSESHEALGQVEIGFAAAQLRKDVPLYVIVLDVSVNDPLPETTYKLHRVITRSFEVRSINAEL